MTTIAAARIDVLTAEVRVLMVGSRQITVSVARQLDQIEPGDIEPFGRVRTGARKPDSAIDVVEVIGAARDGALARWRLPSCAISARAHTARANGAAGRRSATALAIRTAMTAGAVTTGSTSRASGKRGRAAADRLAGLR